MQDNPGGPPPVPPVQPMPPLPPGAAAPQLGYATPAPAGVPDLRTIATRQKAVMYCILVYIALVVAQLFVPNEVPIAKIAIGLLGLAVSVTAAVFVFMLALSVYSQGTGILLGILTLVPCVGLIVLLIINGKATNILKQHGIKVGLLGADPSQIPGPGQGQIYR